MAPRAFVVWFLSMLTLVATRVISKLNELENGAEKIRQASLQAATAADGAMTSVGQAQALVEKVVDQMRALADISRESSDTARTSSEDLTRNSETVVQRTRELLRTVAEAIDAEGNIRKIRDSGPPGELGVESFFDAIRDRSKAMWRAIEHLNSERLRGSLAGDHNPAVSAIAGTVFERVLWPAVARYLAVDPMRFPEDPLVFTLEGDYLLYSRLVENLLRNIILLCRKIDPATGRVEIFTTLNVPPRMWYNVVIPVGWDRRFRDWVGEGKANYIPKKFLDFDPRTNARWEHYKAVQALCIKLGRQDAKGTLGFTRCFLQEGRKGDFSSPSLFRKESFDADGRSLIHEGAIAARNSIVAEIERIARKVTDCRQMEISEETLRLVLGNISRGKWADLAESFTDCIEEHERSDSGDPIAYLYPVLHPAQGEEVVNGWRKLTGDFVDHYQTSPQRALVWNITNDDALSVTVSPQAGVPGKPKLPWDLFAVGVAGPVDNIEDLPRPGPRGEPSISWLFTVSLLTDERGSYTTTRVLTAADQGEAKVHFEAYTMFINDVLRAAISKTGMDVTPLVP